MDEVRIYAVPGLFQPTVVYQQQWAQLACDCRSLAQVSSLRPKRFSVIAAIARAVTATTLGSMCCAGILVGSMICRTSPIPCQKEEKHFGQTHCRPWKKGLFVAQKDSSLSHDIMAFGPVRHRGVSLTEFIHWKSRPQCSS